jgi:hypothetical protein
MRRGRRVRRRGWMRRVSFEVLSAFEPLARVAERSPTLDGGVPLRVAQACAPLLEGNALGRQVVFGKRVVVRSRLGRKTLEVPDAIDRAHRAAVPLLAAQGLLRPAWKDRLARSWWWSERGVLRIWTGLLVRPRAGTWLRVSGSGNQAILGLSIRTAWVDHAAEPVPLVLDVQDAIDGTRLEGIVATLAPVVPDVEASVVDLAEAPELAEAHAAFYDAKYFATKKGEVTKKYRRAIGRAHAAEERSPSRAHVRVAHVAGPRPEIVRIASALGPTATSPVPARSSLDVIRFVNAVPFTAHFDGNTLAIEPDAATLAREAAAVERSLASVLGARWIPAHKGAVLYLTKYFTPHPHGEPHFFLKPWAFTETPPGWSSILEGVRGAGFDVMRGVVWTDRFHATPAVFQLAPGARIRVPAGAPLLDVVAVPRALLEEGVREESLA